MTQTCIYVRIYTSCLTSAMCNSAIPRLTTVVALRRLCKKTKEKRGARPHSHRVGAESPRKCEVRFAHENPNCLCNATADTKPDNALQLITLFPPVFTLCNYTVRARFYTHFVCNYTLVLASPPSNRSHAAARWFSDAGRRGCAQSRAPRWRRCTNSATESDDGRVRFRAT